MSHQYTVLLLVVFFITCTSLPWDKLPTIQPVTVATWQTNKVLCNVNSNKNLFSNKRSCPLLTITKDLDLKHFYAVYFFESGTIYRHISYIEKNMIFGTMSFETKHSFWFCTQTTVFMPETVELFLSPASYQPYKWEWYQAFQWYQYSFKRVYAKRKMEVAEKCGVKRTNNKNPLL